jgi:hypothetical protein
MWQDERILSHKHSTHYSQLPPIPSLPQSSPYLTRHNCRSRNLVRAPIPLRIPLLVINTHQHPRIALPIRSRETNCAPHLGTATTNVNLRTSHVELDATALGRRMQCDDFGAKKVLAWCDARGHGEVNPAARADHAVDTPCSRGHVEAVFVDFEPFLGRSGGGGCIVDFGPVEKRTLILFTLRRFRLEVDERFGTYM